MKSLLLTTAMLYATSASPLFATPDDLFISEYIEGSSNNKAIEIANLTGHTIDLSNYQIRMYFNGNSSVGLTINLSGSLASNKVYVLAHTKASSEILAVANQTQSSGWFNGDDAIVLTSGNAVIDNVGQVGFDPGSQWGSGLISTQNNTLRRRLNPVSTDANTSDTFVPAEQWDGFDNDTFDNLGLLTDTPPPSGSNCDETANFIHEVQGNGSSSPIAGSSVVIEGIVVGDFQLSTQLDGFFIQEEDTDQDNNAQTSEGLFVYDPAMTVEVSQGDKVRVTGTASEYKDMTQISNVTHVEVCSTNNLVTPTKLTLPLMSYDDAENVEGMAVIFDQTLTVSENYNLGRYGELVLSNGRLINPTNVVSPGTAANEMQASNNLNRIILDDGRTGQNPELIPFPQPELSAFNTVRGGDTVTNLQGIMHQAFGAYRIQPTTLPDFQPTNQRTNPPELKSNTLKVASFNVLNYFNGDGSGGGYPTPRGADNAEEFARQRDKIIAAIAAMNADIVGLMEIENDGFDRDSAIVDLINGINTTTGKQYQFVSPDTTLIGTDAITVGIIYDSEKITQNGRAVSLSTGVFATKNRQPLAQSFRTKQSNGEFTIVVNHFKSKGSCPSDAQDPNADQNDGQGCWNQLRTQASQELNQWLATKPTGSIDNDTLIIGDLNAYAMEDPVTTLESSGYTNLLKKYIGPKNYSYVFFGQVGTLDHALANLQLTPQIVDTQVWHINADEPRILDYNLEYKSATQQVTLFNQDPYRASDHDPIIVALKLTPEADINFDNQLNIKDIFPLLKRLNKNVGETEQRYDLNSDGQININDLEIVIRAIIDTRLKNLKT
ncbi:ExeM/NucH family extracellular endonuclease [Aliikangiella sp. IMCC44359]|uniref:ExeM/NucH family extracellular endonuclease n=1 Tax=Aliikangiella sp. IMCC44359 TaxID=3459125 RepID=UPI00403B1762